jgi:hypothetical protein
LIVVVFQTIVIIENTIFMRIVFALTLSVATASVVIPGVDPLADPCWLVCDEYEPDLSGQAALCGPSSSRCIVETDLCTNLYMIDGGLLNSEVAASLGEPLIGEELEHQLTCTQARQLAAHRYTAPRRSPLPPTTRRVFQAPPPPQYYAGVRGLHNIGSVCYFNTALQILTHVTPVREMLENLAQLNQAGVMAVDADTPIIESLHIQYLQSLANLYSGMSDYEAAAGPQSPAAILQNLLNLGYAQYANLGHTGDTSEALLSLFDATEASLASFQGSPAPGALNVIRQIFSIDLRTQTTCASCSGVIAAPRVSNEVLTNINLQPHMRAMTLTEGLHLAFGAGETDFACPRCALPGVASRQIAQAREVFVIQALRVDPMTGHRINTEITFPSGDATLDLTPFLAPASPSLANPHYRLIAIAHHNNGHYYGDILHAGTWYRVDDGRVGPLAGPPASPSTTATMFVYQRVVAEQAAVAAAAPVEAPIPVGELDIAAIIATLQAQTGSS